MNDTIRKYGLIGYPLSHSFSKKYFTQKFENEQIINASYDLFPLEEITHLPFLLQKESHLRGLNVTIPYKEAVIPYLTELSAAARQVGAVNTIRVEDNRLLGDNTDVYGFEHSLVPLLEKKQSYKALIFGTGGAAKGVAYVLQKLQIDYQMVSRNVQKTGLTYTDLTPEIMAYHHLLINTTPLGMYPKIEAAVPIIYDKITTKHILYDLVYNPTKTLFLKRGEKQGARIKNGLEMLFLQAEKAWAVWNA